ncbi:MAG: hypothetical protein DME24_23480 [Verrucomicrobia bacterium]|nr:MAG: hypothetical protein DME24_23480 [Verrucomicrobiota bacterium]
MYDRGKMACDPAPRIVAEVERRLSVVKEMEWPVSLHLQSATRLLRSILHRAFSCNAVIDRQTG